MVKKTVTSPDGKTINIDAPDDATDDETIEFAQSELQKQGHELDKAAGDAVRAVVSKAASEAVGSAARDAKALQAMIEGQDKALDMLRDDVLNMAKLMLALTERIDAMEKRKVEAPNVHMSPNINLNPDVKVVSDPAMSESISEAMREMSRMNEAMLQKIIESLTTFGEAMSKAQPKESGEMEFQIIPVHEQRSPRFGRIDRIRLVKPSDSN